MNTVWVMAAIAVGVLVYFVAKVLRKAPGPEPKQEPVQLSPDKKQAIRDKARDIVEDREARACMVHAPQATFDAKASLQRMQVQVQIAKTKSPPISDDEEHNTQAGMFASPMSLFGDDLMNDAYWQVMDELEGDGLERSMLAGIQHEFLTINDRRKAGKLLCETLLDIPWIWPRWNKQCRRVGMGYDPVEPKVAPAPTRESTLNAMTKDELTTLGAEFGVALKMSMTKQVMTEKLHAVPADKLAAALQPLGEALHRKQVIKGRQTMAEFIFSRVNTIAYEKARLDQLMHPDSLEGMPYWRFICSEEIDNSSPAKCRKLNGTVLHVAQAIRTFPKFPCERIACHCRVTGQRTATEHIGRGR